MADQRQPQGLITSSDYQLTTLMIINSTGDGVDVKPVLLSLDLFEDIFSPVMTGKMVLGDGADIISNFQLHGNEYVILAVDKPTLNKPIVKTFRIYKISDRRFDETALQNYTVHFCSEELILSTQTLLSHSYKGMQISAMVKDIIVNRLEAPTAKMANGIFETTTGNFDLIIPRMQPLEAIQWLTPRAYNSNENLFLFFENRDGFNFVSYEKLLAQAPYTTYTRIAKIKGQDPAQNMTGWNMLQVPQDFDVVKGMRFGGYASSLISVDLLNRQQSVKTFNYKNVSQKTGLLNGNVPDNGLNNRLGFPLSNSFSSMVKMVPSTDSDPTNNPENIQNWMPQTIARLGQINMHKQLMSVPGDVLVKAGAVVGIEMPLMAPQDKAIQTDPIRSGNYLVSAVHHHFEQDIMATVVELLSDSVGTALNAALNNNSAIKKLVNS